MVEGLTVLYVFLTDFVMTLVDSRPNFLLVIFVQEIGNVLRDEI